jgi:hypothetical protein
MEILGRLEMLWRGINFLIIQKVDQLTPWQILAGMCFTAWVGAWSIPILMSIFEHHFYKRQRKEEQAEADRAEIERLRALCFRAGEELSHSSVLIGEKDEALREIYAAHRALNMRAKRAMVHEEKRKAG